MKRFPFPPENPDEPKRIQENPNAKYSHPHTHAQAHAQAHPHPQAETKPSEQPTTQPASPADAEGKESLARRGEESDAEQAKTQTETDPRLAVLKLLADAGVSQTARGRALLRNDVTPQRVREELAVIHRLGGVRDVAAALCARLDLRGTSPDGGSIGRAVSGVVRSYGKSEADERREAKRAKEHPEPELKIPRFADAAPGQGGAA